MMHGRRKLKVNVNKSNVTEVFISEEHGALSVWLTGENGGVSLL